MTQDNIEMSFQPGMKVHLTGYTSTSSHYECALNFALRDYKVSSNEVLDSSETRNSDIQMHLQDGS